MFLLITDRDAWAALFIEFRGNFIIYLEWWLCHRLRWVLAIQATAQAEISESEANILVYARHLLNLG